LPPEFRKAFDTTLKQIQKQKTRLKERAHARSLQRSQPQMWNELERLQIAHKRRNSSSSASETEYEDHVDLPFNNLPFPPDPNFSWRDDFMKELQENLDHTPSQDRLRSWGLYGLPAMGKTSLALEYAHRRISSGVKVVLWVDAEKGVDMDLSFTQIAVKMGLQSAGQNNDHVKNRLLVTRWLSRTGMHFFFSLLFFGGSFLSLKHILTLDRTRLAASL
jgi:hypothetical protein